MTGSATETQTATSLIRTFPILRIFSVEKAKYMQVSRSGLHLHLSEHHGDGAPGIHIHVEMTGVDQLHREVTSKGYRFLRPGVEDQFYTGRERCE